jgi:LmbE family N-acetylglucosaminyl deacetylase
MGDLLGRFCYGPMPHTVFVAAHPDDETIGAGSRISMARNLRLIHVTDGAPRTMQDAHRCGFNQWQDYAAARRSELEAALARAGFPADRAISLCLPDQEAACFLEKIASQLVDLFSEWRPELVLTHPYEGGHPDHDACAFAVRAALARTGNHAALGEFASYHALPGEPLAFGFLPAAGTPEITLRLSAPECDRKRRMLACFGTQQETLRQFPVDVERFRIAPAYDFRQPPHAGTLHYERYAWGMTGARFRRLASEAMAWA